MGTNPQRRRMDQTKGGRRLSPITHHQAQAHTRRWFEFHALVTGLLFLLTLQSNCTQMSQAQMQALEYAYDLTTWPFTNTNSTIPPEYDQQNTTSHAVFDPADLRDYWCDEVAWVENGCINATWCWNMIEFNIPVGGPYTPEYISISPTGLIGLGYNRYIARGGFTPSFMSIAQPDWRIDFDGGPLWTFYNAQLLWNIKELNYSILYPSNTSSTPPAAALLRIRGSLISFFNATHPNSNTALEFEFQFDSNTGIIVMHIISLENATAADLHSPISIGMTYPRAAGTMFINNEFVTNRTISRTLVWTPYNPIHTSNEGCLGAVDCSTCIQRPNCYFCESTSGCVDIYHNLTSTTSSSSSAIIPISSHCPEGVVLSTCPPAIIYSCHDCVAANGHWCTGEANCFYVNGTAADGCVSGNAYEYLQAGEWVPYCVGANDTCGQQTCNDVHDSQHSMCAPFGPYSSSPTCVCETGYSTDDPQCTICSSGYYQDPDDGSCVECPNISATLIIIFIVVGVVVTFVLIKLNSHPLFRRLLVPIQNSIVYFQVVSLLELIDFHWPLGVRKTLTAISILGLNLFHLPKLDVTCYLSPTQTLIFTLVAPVLILVLLFLCGFVGSGFIARNIQSVDEAIRASDQFAGVLVRAFLTFLILFYNHLVWQLMDAYTGDLIDWYHYDLSRMWSTGKWVFIGTVVYIIGVPLLFWAIIFPRHRPTRCCCCIRPVSRSSILIPLISRYRPGLCQYWECTFVPLWKILFNAIVVFGSGRNQQIALLSSLLILMIFSYTMIAPYTSVLNNREQSWLMGGSLLILLSGLFFYESEPGDTTGKLVLLCLSYFLIIGTMVLMVLLMGYVMVVVYQEYRKEQAAAPDHEVSDDEVGAVGDVSVSGNLAALVSSDDDADDDNSPTPYVSLSTSRHTNPFLSYPSSASFTPTAAAASTSIQHVATLSDEI